jgi:hypothetical protein
MKKQDFEALKSGIIDKLNKLEYIESKIEGIGKVGSDETDIGNHIGMAVGEVLIPL